ncbi:MAG: GNAT family N-acetyltransferase [Sulfitobacter sp.]
MSAMTDHIPTVETDRLILRAPKLADLPALTTYFASARSHMAGGPKNERDVYRSMLSVIGSWALRGYGFWHIADKQTDALLGATGILFGPGWDEPELGWNVVEAAEGKGIAFEATTAARTYSAQHLGHDGVISYLDAKNTRSIALARRLGAKFERDGIILDHDVLVYRHPKEAT